MIDFNDEVLLITGGTGSFGNAVVSRFLASNVREIRIFSRDEKKQEEMRLSLNNSKLKFYIGDVRDYDSIYQALKGVDYVFHAAALKQVPSCEFFPIEAFKTNVMGANNVINASIALNIKKLVVLSTDKAVYPINAMGISKAMSEKVMVARSRQLSNGDTVLCATRYGNVMASRGSVIPLFISQIQHGKNITITDPCMTRFLMSLKDSVDLVVYAFRNAQQGDIFVQKAPASTVLNLAHALIDLFGGTKDNIKIIGTRHGEKLFESLVSREEMAKAEDLGRYYRIPADNRDLNYSDFFDVGELKVSELNDFTSHNADQLNVSGVKNLLLNLDYIQAELNA
jgi:UDP-glucose 4-epimerase